MAKLQRWQEIELKNKAELRRRLRIKPKKRTKRVKKDDGLMLQKTIDRLAESISYQARRQDNKISRVERDTKRRFQQLPRDLKCPYCMRGPLLSSKMWVVLGKVELLVRVGEWDRAQRYSVALCKRCWCNPATREKLAEQYVKPSNIIRVPQGLRDAKPLPEHYCYDGLNYEQRKQRKKSEEKRAKKIEMLPADRVCNICNMLKPGLRQWIIDKNGVAMCRSCFAEREN